MLRYASAMYMYDAMIDMNDIDGVVIRASSLTGYDDCPRRGATRLFPVQIAEAGYELRYLDKHIGAIVGSAAHAGLKYTLTCKMNGEESYRDEAEDHAMQTFDSEISHGAIFDATTPSIDTAKHQARKVMTAVRNYALLHIEPALVEIRLHARINDTFYLSGQPDFIDVNHVGGDLKTGVKAKPNGPQYGAYQMLFESNQGSENPAAISGFYELHAPRVATTKQQPHPVRIDYDMQNSKEQAIDAMTRIMTDYNSFAETKSHRSFSSNPSSMLCSPKYCAAFGTNFCKDHIKKFP